MFQSLRHWYELTQKIPCKGSAVSSSSSSAFPATSLGFTIFGESSTDHVILGTSVSIFKALIWTDSENSLQGKCGFFFFVFSVPSYISGVHHFWWDFGLCDCFLFFCSNHRSSQILSSWIVHAGCVFVACIHPSRTWMSGSLESVRWCMCAQTRPRFILSSQRVLGEWSQNPC